MGRSIRTACTLCRKTFKNPPRLLKHLRDVHGVVTAAEAPTSRRGASTPPAAPAGIVHVYTDGGCNPNPGPGGWGVVLIWGSTEKELCGGDLTTTNNRMEMTAAIEALKALTRPVNVQIHTDSQYLRNGITKWIAGWKRNGWRTKAGQPVKNVELWTDLDRLVALHTVTWTWVKGHAGNVGNERADKLATRGRKEVLARQRAALPSPSPPSSALMNTAPARHLASQDLEVANA